MARELRCPIHGKPLVCYCPACRGATRSKRKATASRKNGRRGGRPRLPKRLLTTAGLKMREYRERLKAEADKSQRGLNSERL